MLVLIFLVLLLFFIFAMLFRALYFLLFPSVDPKAMFRSFVWRIFFSCLVFALLMMLWFFDIIRPHPLVI